MPPEDHRFLRRPRHFTRIRHGALARCRNSIRTSAPTAVLLALTVGCAGAESPHPAASPPATTHVATQTSTPASQSTPTLPTVDPYPDRPLIDRVQWTSTARGRQLRIYPTAEGRQDRFPAAGDRAWHEVITAAPDAPTPGMQDQFFCHWNLARVVQPDKPSWDLEPWRPDVGYQATVDALCNPGGPEG